MAKLFYRLVCISLVIIGIMIMNRGRQMHQSTGVHPHTRACACARASRTVESLTCYLCSSSGSGREPQTCEKTKPAVSANNRNHMHQRATCCKYRVCQQKQGIGRFRGLSIFDQQFRSRFLIRVEADLRSNFRRNMIECTSKL